MIREIRRTAASGLIMLAVLLPAGLFFALNIVRAGVAAETPGVILFTLLFILDVFLLGGLFTVQPGQAKVLQLFGEYRGTVRDDGLRWANPFFTKKAVSLRVRNFETAKLKVNDHNSNPIEIAAVVVWQVTDTAEALFEVDSYEDYVRVQSEAAVRGLANQ